MASKDMNVAIESKGAMEDMLGEIGEFNDLLSRQLDELTTVSAAINHDVGVAVRNLQFEDVVRQVLDHAHSDIVRVEEFLGAVLNVIENLAWNPDQGDADHHELLRRCRVEVEALGREIETKQHKPVGQQSLTEGEVDLF